MSARIPLLAANWKMNLTRREARNLVEDLLKAAYPVSEREVVLCPPFHMLAEIGELLNNKTHYGMGAQDVYWKESGAFTGEVSAPMLRDCGCSHTLVGHSERRALFAETDADCQKKVEAALAHNLVPILCVGETLEEREAGRTGEVTLRQLKGALAGQQIAGGDKLVVAYEPVWAIGTGKTDTPPDADKTMGALRAALGELFGERVAATTRLLYGGSVKPDNVDAFMACTHIDGALVGGAALKADSFARIVNFQSSARV